MQTFLPFSSFEKSAQCLDYRRLGKQRVEAMQIIKAIKSGSGWSKHPAVKMWVGYTPALNQYCNAMIVEWIKRGYQNNMLYTIEEEPIVYPWWLGNEDFHRAMRSRLIEKQPEFYLSLFPEDKGFNDGKYLWPVMETKTFRII